MQSISKHLTRDAKFFSQCARRLVGRDRQVMLTQHARQYSKRFNLSVGVTLVLIVGLMAFAVLCQMVVPEASHDGRWLCQHVPWYVASSAPLSFITILIWLLPSSRQVCSQAHPLMVFRPPRRIPR